MGLMAEDMGVQKKVFSEVKDIAIKTIQKKTQREKNLEHKTK